MIPRNPTQSSKNLGFSSFVSCTPSMNYRISVSRLSLNHSSSKFGFSVDTRVRKEFIFRAEEGNTETESEEAVSEIADTEGNVEEVGEAKPQRKPRIKLGDVMGVSELLCVHICVE